MKELVNLVSEQVEKEREGCIGSDYVWWNGELHIPILEKKIVSRNNGNSKMINTKGEKLYTIVRLDRLHDKDIHTTKELVEFLDEHNPPNTYTMWYEEEGFNFWRECVVRAGSRCCKRDYRMKHWPERYADFEDKPPIEEMTLEEYLKMLNTTLSIKELASYMEISMNRAKTLVRCPGFPAKKVGNSNRVKIPLGALNTWLKRFAALSMVSTGELIHTVECMIDIG